MTAEEAIKWITNFQDNIALKIPIEDVIDDKRYSLAINATKKAIEALEKQIPKKPTLEIRHSVHPQPYCPSCGYDVFSQENDKWCRHCGQAIDWSK